MADNTKPDLKTLLASSSSFISLQAERAIINELERLGWATTHSAYYVDPITEKTREIDVVGRRSWRQTREAGDLQAQLNLVFEAKSNSGYHLLFAPTEVVTLKRHDYWIGSDDETRDSILDRLAAIGVSKEQLRALDGELREVTAPNEGPMLIRGLRAEPPPAPFYAGTYRETNIQKEKELDNSVLWRAGQALSSAVRSYKGWIFGNEMSDTTAFTIEAIKAGNPPIKEAMRWLSNFVRDYYMFHPILVIDSSMWALNGTDLEPLKWCRFIQTDLGGFYKWWFDIVHSPELPAYLAGLTKHYSDHYKGV